MFPWSEGNQECLEEAQDLGRDPFLKLPLRIATALPGPTVLEKQRLDRLTGISRQGQTGKLAEKLAMVFKCK